VNETCGIPTLRDGPPGQRDVGEEGVERRGLLALALLPQVEGLREAAHRPQRVVRAVVQLCNMRAAPRTLPSYHIRYLCSHRCLRVTRQIFIKTQVFIKVIHS
jgi:hypothetical protein